MIISIFVISINKNNITTIMTMSERIQKKREIAYKFLDDNAPKHEFLTYFHIHQMSSNNQGTSYSVTNKKNGNTYQFIFRHVEDFGRVLNRMGGGLYFNKWSFYRNNTSSFFKCFDDLEMDTEKVKEFLALPDLYLQELDKPKQAISIEEYSAYIFLAQYLGFTHE